MHSLTHVHNKPKDWTGPKLSFEEISKRRPDQMWSIRFGLISVYGGLVQDWTGLGLHT